MEILALTRSVVKNSRGNLPMPETHVMEHRPLFLQGSLRARSTMVSCKKGDLIWMASYCQQWFTAMGKEPAVYIYYKNVNRFSAAV